MPTGSPSAAAAATTTTTSVAATTASTNTPPPNVDSRGVAVPPAGATPQQQRLSQTNLYIRGLSPDTTDKDLVSLCQP